MTSSSKSVIYIVTDLWPLPDKIQEVKKILAELVPEAKKDRTCLKYELCENVNEKGQFTFLEAWSNEEALQEHLKCEFLTKAVAELQSLMAKPPEFRRYKNIG